MKSRTLFLFAILVIFSTTTLAEQATMSFVQLETIAKKYIENKVKADQGETLQIKLSESAKSLNLPVCSNEVNVSSPSDGANGQITTLELTCTGENSWHTYIPVEVNVMTTVLVAKEAIYPNEEITDDKLDLASYDKNSLYTGFFKDKIDLHGKVASRLIPAGAVITKKNITAQLLIHRNQAISIVAKKGSIMIKAEGIARSDGALNDMIKVYNPTSKRTLDAVVVDAGTAEVM